MGSICQWYMCILLYMKLIWCSCFPEIYGKLEEGGLGICAFFYMWKLFSVEVLHKCMVNWRRGFGICAFCYMWNLNGVVVFHKSMVKLEGQMYALSICALCYMWNLFRVVVFHRSMANWRRGGYICLRYMCIFQYVTLIWCSGVPEIYGQLEEGGMCCLGIYASANMWNLFGVVVFQTSLVNWRGVQLPYVYVHSAIC